MEGVVCKIVTPKFFGFITTGTNEEYFFHKDDFGGHWDDLSKDFYMKETIKVTFDPVDTPKGLRARNVRRLDWPNQ